MAQSISQLFTEIFRPQTLEQAILVPRIRTELAKGVTTNTLCCGPAGTGKCLGPDEEIEIFIDEKTRKELKKFLGK